MTKTHARTGGAAAGLLGLLVAVLASGPAAAQTRCGDAVTVSPGDTLYRIASRCGTTVSALLAANPRIGDPRGIRVGARLAMPGTRRAARDRGRAPRRRAGPEGDGRGYVVRPGDTLAAIAGSVGVPLPALIAMNPGIDPRALRPGLTIRLSGDERDRGDRGDRRDRGERDRGRGNRIAVAGTITREGVECPALRGDNGRLYTLAGDLGRFGPGDRVRVRGAHAQASICQQGTTIKVERIRSARGGGGRPGGMTVTGTLTGEGVECPALRGDNGRLYTLAGDTGRFGPGDRVRVRGARAQASICQQGTTIKVERVRAAG